MTRRFALLAVACFGASAIGAPAPQPSGETTAPNVDAAGDPLPEGALLRLGSVRFLHPESVYELALSPDERTIVTMGNQVIAWDAATGRRRWQADLQKFNVRFGGVSYGMRMLAFSPDGGRVYTPGPRGMVLAWDAATGRELRIELKEPLQPRAGDPVWDHAGPRSVDVSPDGEKLAVGGPEGVIVCDLNGRSLFAVKNVVAAPVEINNGNNDRLTFGGHAMSGQFSPDGRLLAVNGSDEPNVIRLHDVETGEERLRIPTTARVVRLAFSPDGERIAATERDCGVRLYDVETGKPVWSHVVKMTDPYENYTSGIAYAHDGKTIAACARNSFIYLLDATTGAEIGVLKGHAWNPWSAAFTRDGSMLYSCGWDGHVCRWDVAALELIPLPTSVRASGVVAMGPDGERIAYEDDAGKIHIVDAGDGHDVQLLELPGTQYSQLAYSPDGRLLAGGGTSGDDIHVAVWDLGSGKVLHRWDWPKGRDPNSRIEGLAFSPNGRWLAAASFRQDAALWWDLATGEQVARHEHEEVYGLAFSPDSANLATVGWDSTIRFWNPETGALRSELKVDPQGRDDDGGVFMDGDFRMYGVAYAPRGGLLATQHMNGQIRAWDAASMKLVATIDAGGSFSWGTVSFSPDGLWIATGMSSGRLSLWDAFTGRMVWSTGAHEDSVYRTAFGRDSRRLVSGGSDGACYLWSLAPPGPTLAADDDKRWQELSSAEGELAYRALWTLGKTPDSTTTLIAEKLRGVDTLVDVEDAENAPTSDEADRVIRLKRLLVRSDPSVESRTAARRAIALLSQFQGQSAHELLEELAARNPAGELARLAAEALEPRRSVEP